MKDLGTRLTDGQGRRFYYLRLSVTEVCNFRCAYCWPHGFQKTGDDAFLTVDEVGRVASAFSVLGVRKVRLTGGEPTTRKDITDLIARTAATPGVAKIAMTTNGWNLAKHAGAWRDAGLTAVNVSIDSLDPGRFAAITGHDRLNDVVAGVDAGLAEDFAAVKVNAVLLRDNAEAEFKAFAAFARTRPVAVRFIELMRTRDNAAYFKDQHLSGDVLKAWLDREGWIPRTRAFDDGPAVEYVHRDHKGRIGLIAPYGPGFCDSCNRLRVTARGKLRLCLFGEGGVELRDLLQADADRDTLVERIIAAMGGKAAGHRLAEDDPGDTRHLAQLGG
jgi:cyclic pyranopterin phosphate synthase